MSWAGACSSTKEIAAYWYRLSAAAGHDWGQYHFANMLFDGRGVPIDRAAAFEWYGRAAWQGTPAR